jgi:hypothetical protein
VEIVLGSAEVESGEFVTGTLIDRDAGNVIVALMRRTGSPFGERVDEVRSFLVEGDKFALAGPGVPISGGGPLLPVEWWVEARSGSELATAPVDVSCGALTVESTVIAGVAERSESANLGGLLLAAIAAIIGLIGVATAFGTDSTLVRVLSGVAVVGAWLPLAERVLAARHRSSIGKTSVEVESHSDGFDCIVRVVPGRGSTDTSDTRTINVNATLIVAEMASKSHLGRGPTVHEEIVATVPIPLEGQRSKQWVGTVATEAISGFPMSIRDKRGSTSWVIKVITSASGSRDHVLQIPLLVYPTDLPESQRPTSVEIPAAAK